MKKKISVGLAIVLPAIVACSQQDGAATDAPQLTSEGLASADAVYWGAMTIDAPKAEGANKTSWGNQLVRASFTLSGGTAKAGVCLLSEIFAGDPLNPVTCSSTADCPSTSGYPAGSVIYCAVLGGQTDHRCYVRPGGQADMCAGSPAISGNPAIGAGTYYTPWASAWTGSIGSYDYYDNYLVEHSERYSFWISYACFNGCSGAGGAPTTPSVSTNWQYFEEGTDGIFSN